MMVDVWKLKFITIWGSPLFGCVCPPRRPCPARCRKSRGFFFLSDLPLARAGFLNFGITRTISLR